jgi:hypothetical protein
MTAQEVPMTHCSMGRSLIVGLMALAGASAAPAEEQQPAASGPRVRLTAPTVSGKRLVGTLTAMDLASLTLRREDGSRVEVPRAALTRIELSRGPSRKGRGARIGALIGIGAAVVLGVAAGDDCNFPPARPEDLDLAERLDRNLCFGKGQIALAASVLTVPLGTLLGFAAASGERWQVTSPDRFRMAVAPARGGGVGASLSFRF